MAQRIDKSWLVFASIENFEHERCVDFFSRPDGSFGFEEFRGDPEDRGLGRQSSTVQGQFIPRREA
jgi:hypothetical protein